MEDIQAIIFLLPVIALILTSILYFYFLHTVTDKKAFTVFIFTVAAVAFLLNFTWEVIQIPLYKGSSFTINHIAFCALGTLADVIMVLLLYLGLAFIFRNPFWVKINGNKHDDEAINQLRKNGASRRAQPQFAFARPPFDGVKNGHVQELRH